jgi:hypothetical protein
MTSGYRMTERQFPLTIDWPYPIPQERAKWPFLAVEPVLSGKASSAETAKFRNHLRVGSQLAFRIWELHPILRGLRWVLAGAAVAALALALWLLWKWRLHIDTTVGAIVSSVSAIVITAGISYAISVLFGPWAARAVSYRSKLRRWLAGIAIATVGAALAWTHLLFFDRMFRGLGKVDRSRARAADPLPPLPDKPNHSEPDVLSKVGA